MSPVLRHFSHLHHLRVFHGCECTCRMGLQILKHTTFFTTGQPTLLSYARLGYRGSEQREKLWGYQDLEMRVESGQTGFRI